MANINMPLTRWAEEINTFKPSVLIGYPSGIKILCDLLNKGQIKLELLLAVSVGEPLTKSVRQYLKHTLNCEVLDLYGTSESIVIGLGREMYNGIYLFDDLFNKPIKTSFL